MQLLLKFNKNSRSPNHRIDLINVEGDVIACVFADDIFPLARGMDASQDKIERLMNAQPDGVAVGLVVLENE